jgi:glycosyltransferase involved in cell wall biosynthesis
LRIIIATVQIPFVRGGAEVLAEGLREVLQAQGHAAEIVTIPFTWHPPERILDHLLICRLLDLTESSGEAVDRVIGLKFPAYLIQHTNKVLWLLHQHKAAYELWDHPLNDLSQFPNGAKIRSAIQQADQQFIPEAKHIFTIAATVSDRLKKYCGVDSVPLYHPPRHADQFYGAEAEDYLFFPSRLAPVKRQSLVLEAMAYTCQPIRLRFAGAADSPFYAEELKRLASKLNVEHRVEWLGHVTEEEKRRYYAHARGVIFPPLDEDYGYVTLEAMLASKPVITCEDSGGPLEFICHKKTGLIAKPTPEGLARAMDKLWSDREYAKELGEAGKARYLALNISWSEVVKRLLA